MSSIMFGAKARTVTLSAVITRADGGVEDIGTIAYYHRNPVLSWAVNLLISVKRRIKG